MFKPSSMWTSIALNPSKYKLPTGTKIRLTILNRHRTSVGNAWMRSVGIALIVGFLIAAYMIPLINASSTGWTAFDALWTW